MHTKRTGFDLGAYIDILAKGPLLQGLPKSLAQYIGQHATPMHEQHNKILFLKDEPGTFIAFVVQGQIYHTLQEPDGWEIIIDHTRMGELAGEIALMGSSQRNDNALLDPGCRLLILHQPHFAILQNEPIFMKRVQQQICARLRRISNYIETVCLYRLETRLARYFLAEIEEQGRILADGGIEIAMPANQSILASRLNVSRPRLNTQLQQWQRAGWICQHGRTLHIIQMENLQKIAQQGRHPAQKNP